MRGFLFKKDRTDRPDSIVSNGPGSSLPSLPEPSGITWPFIRKTRLQIYKKNSPAPLLNFSFYPSCQF